MDREIIAWPAFKHDLVTAYDLTRIKLEKGAYL